MNLQFLVLSGGGPTLTNSQGVPWTGAHFQMFNIALESIHPNFSPGILQGDPRFSHTFFNISNGVCARGPWNEGQGSRPNGEQWEYIDDPIAHVMETQGLHQHQGTGTKMT